MRTLPFIVAATLLGLDARAELPPNGSPIRTSDYRIDLHQGPVLGGSRVLALAGAYVAIAEGVDGTSQNPAAPAVRTRWSFEDFDYDLGAGVTFPSTLKETDFFNAGKETRLGEETGFLFVDLAANLQFGAWGFGGSFQLQAYSLLRVSGAEERRDKLSAQIGIGHWGLARTFFDGQLALGGSVRTTGLTVVNSNALPGESGELISTIGVGLEGGALWRPAAWPFRLGAALRSSVTPLAFTADRDRVLYEGTGDELYLPNEVTLPWELNLGGAVQLGPRVFNPRWRAPSAVLAGLRRRLEKAAATRRRELERSIVPDPRLEQTPSAERAAREARSIELEADLAIDEALLETEYQQLVSARRAAHRREDRFYVLVSSSVQITGASENAVGVEAFLDRTVDRSGEHASVSPRLGVEGEVIPNWLRLGIGSYWEPTRFRSNTGGGRAHATMGFSLKLFPWTVLGLFEQGTEWRIGGAIDSARQYLGWGATAGVWR